METPPREQEARTAAGLRRDIRPEDRLLNSVGLDRFASRPALDQMVTENGANFSGGEKKRICLAWALLRNTDMLILDEPLANLDGGRRSALRICCCLSGTGRCWWCPTSSASRNWRPLMK